MKKSPFLSLLLTVSYSVILLWGCKNNETYSINMRLANGDHFEQTMTSNMEISTPLMGKDQKMKMQNQVACDFNVLSTANKQTKIKMTYQNLKTTMDMGQLNGMGGGTDSLLNSQSEILKGKSVELTLSENHEVVDVTGTTEMFTDVNLNEKTKALIRKMFSKEQIMNLWGMMFSMYPKKPVAIGDSWQSKTKTDMAGFEVTIAITYTLKSVQDGLAGIDLVGKVDGKGKMNEMPMEMDMKGSQKGKITINMKDGYLKKANYQMTIEANMGTGGQKIPMTLAGDYVLEGK